MAGLLGNHAAQKVFLIISGNCDQKIGSGDTRFQQCLMVDAVPHDAHHIQTVGNILNLFRLFINDNNIVIFVAELFDKRKTNFSTAYDNNVHRNLLKE